MEELKCKKCGGEHIGLRTDKRGVAEYYCEDCGTGQGKASSVDLVAIISDLRNSAKQTENKNDRPPCRYCSEDYFIRLGRLGTQYIPMEITYCPMCGRKINREKDRGV